MQVPSEDVKIPYLIANHILMNHLNPMVNPIVNPIKIPPALHRDDLTTPELQNHTRGTHLTATPSIYTYYYYNIMNIIRHSA